MRGHPVTTECDSFKPSLRLTPWGKFVTKHGVAVPRQLWGIIREEAEKLLEQEADWQIFFEELIGGCQELGREELLLEFVAQEDEARDQQGQRVEVRGVSRVGQTIEICVSPRVEVEAGTLVAIMRRDYWVDTSKVLKIEHEGSVIQLQHPCNIQVGDWLDFTKGELK